MKKILMLMLGLITVFTACSGDNANGEKALKEIEKKYETGNYTASVITVYEGGEIQEDYKGVNINNFEYSYKFLDGSISEDLKCTDGVLSSNIEGGEEGYSCGDMYEYMVEHFEYYTEGLYDKNFDFKYTSDSDYYIITGYFDEEPSKKFKVLIAKDSSELKYSDDYGFNGTFTFE